jgi:hypothetical protein
MTDYQQASQQSTTEEFTDLISVNENTTIHPRLQQTIADYISGDTQTGADLKEFLPIGLSYDAMFPVDSLIIGAIEIKGTRDINTRKIVGRVTIIITVTVSEIQNITDYYLKINAEKYEDMFVGDYFIKYVKGTSYNKVSNMRQEKLHYEDRVKDGTHQVTYRGNITKGWCGYDITKQYANGKLLSLTNTHVEKLASGWLSKHNFTTIFDGQGNIVLDRVSSDMFSKDNY